MSYGVATELQFSCNNLLEERSLCSQLLKHPLVGTLVLPRDSQQSSKAPHLICIDLIFHLLGEGPRLASIRRNEEGSRPSQSKFKVVIDISSLPDLVHLLYCIDVRAMRFLLLLA